MHGFTAIQAFIAFTRLIVPFIDPIGGKQGIETAGLSVNRKSLIVSFVAWNPGIKFETDILPLPQQIFCIYRLCHDCPAGCTDACRRRAGAFLYSDYFYQCRVKQESAVMVEQLGIRICIIYFNINLILPHASDGHPLWSTVSPAETDWRFVE